MTGADVLLFTSAIIVLVALLGAAWATIVDQRSALQLAAERVVLAELEAALLRRELQALERRRAALAEAGASTVVSVDMARGSALRVDCGDLRAALMREASHA